MNKLILSISFLFLYMQCQAQDYQVIDSLEKSLAGQGKEDTNTVRQYFRLGHEFTWSIPDSSIYYFNKSFALSQQLRYVDGKFNALIGRSYPLALVRSDSAAASSAFSAAKIAEEHRNVEYLGRSYFTLATVYILIKQYDKGILYHSKALNYINPNTSFFGTNLLNATNEHLTQCYLGLNNLDSALVYINKVLDYNKQHNIIYGFDIYLKGSIFLEQGSYDTALRYFKEALQASVHDNIKKDISDCYIAISKVFQRKNLPDSGIHFARKALDIANSVKLPNEKLESLNLLITLFESDAKIDSAYTYQKYTLTLKDSLLNAEKIRQVQLLSFNEEIRKLEENQLQRKRSFNTVIYSLIAALLITTITAVIIFKNNRQRKRAYVLLQKQKQETDLQRTKAEQTLQELKSTQAQLIQSEKMASLGELTAGIAHEIQNPLNFVNNFSEVNSELINEMVDEADKGNTEGVKTIAYDIRHNLEKISHHGKRADAIVKGMLQHSQTSTGKKEATNINALADEYLRLSYHGHRAKDNSFNAKMKADFDETVGTINIVPQDIGRVLLNLYNNAFYAVGEKKKQQSTGYEPTVSVSTKKEKDKVEIRVKDNGDGIPQNIIDKIFQPFFTTKPTGQGTGLGLSLAHDIVKAHGGEIKVETKQGGGSEFLIRLPYS